ncbi:hypothetical protein [Nonomuraea guangzhouensis]|uniref:Aminoglycoside phosphotransferase domain-containing protein n=1 Tax=Nonomuraea guangzhouensis TaxID=1291555 RepID=A0ABW4FYZ4_9ACTN|nr:hypothetical protein [Nonomuraea guangzhouensis]
MVSRAHHPYTTTDYNPLNMLIAEGRALLIDWAWPTRGAGWIDPACLKVGVNVS